MELLWELFIRSTPFMASAFKLWRYLSPATAYWPHKENFTPEGLERQRRLAGVGAVLFFVFGVVWNIVADFG